MKKNCVDVPLSEWLKYFSVKEYLLHKFLIDDFYTYESKYEVTVQGTGTLFDDFTTRFGPTPFTKRVIPAPTIEFQIV